MQRLAFRQQKERSIAMEKERSCELHYIIRQLRKECGETQKELAEYLGVDVSTYAHYEAGNRTPDIKRLRMLAQSKRTNVSTF